MSEYIEIRASLPEETEDQLADAFTAAAILGVQIEPVSGGRIDVAVWLQTGSERRRWRFSRF